MTTSTPSNYTLALAIAVRRQNAELAASLIREVCNLPPKEGKTIFKTLRNNLSAEQDKWLSTIVSQIRNGD